MGVTMYEFANANRDRILARSIDMLVRHAGNVPRKQLAGSLPGILDDILSDLATDRVEPHDSLHVLRARAARHQGLLRFQQGFEVQMVVRCFGLLCDSIMALGEEDRVQFDTREMRILNQSVDSGIADAVECFMAQVRQANQVVARERIGALAHELRNALSSVMVGFEALKEGRAGFAGKTATIVTRGLDRMTTLISQTLAASKLQPGEEPEITLQRLRSTIEEIVDALPPSDVKLVVDIEKDATIEADHTLMTSAVGNLIQNAVKFTHAGGTVTVRATVSTDSGNAIIEVEDECGGLGVSDPEVLFKPFQQRDPSRGGAGLGLAIVRDAVVSHGGTVEAYDRAPKGCLFILRWPLTFRRTGR